MENSRWHLELWTPGGKQIADLTGLAKSRRITQIRNDAEDINWRLDLDSFERYAEQYLQGKANEFIVPGVTEVRVRRGKTYLCGGQVTYANPRITNKGAVYEIRAQGFLNLLLDRITVGDSGDPTKGDDRTFSAINPPTMLAALITESQGVGPDWDFGFTIGLVPDIGNPVDKTYKQQEIKEAIQFGNDQYNIDHAFTYNKVFNQYAPIGSIRPDLNFEYPGNILEIPQAPEDATNVANWIFVRGSGSGNEGGNYTTRQSTSSQVDYKVRQKKVSFSDVDGIEDLERHGDAQLDAFARPFQIPKLLVDGNQFPYVTDYDVGDYVPIRLRRYSVLSGAAGLARVERRDIEIDENDNEQVTLYVSK